MKKPPVWIFAVPLVMVIALGLVTIHVWKKTLADTYGEEQGQLINRASVLISKELGLMEQITNYMREELESIVPQSFDSEDAWRRAVETQLKQTRHLSNIIAQLRWLSPDGQELVRVDVRPNGTTQAIPKSELQNKSGRYYFIKGSQLAQGQTLITPTDLNVEHGRIVVPYEPTTRSVTKLEGPQGEWQGLLVVNFNVSSVLEQIRLLQTPENTLQVIDNQGNWLLSYIPEREWRHMYGDYTMALPQLYPDAWQRIQTYRTLTKESLDGLPTLVSPSAINLDPQSAPRTYLIAKVRPDVWLKSQLIVYGVTGMVAILIYGALVALVWFRWRLVTQKAVYVERIRHDKARIEKAHTRLKENNQNLVMMQKELVEQSKLSALGMLVAGVGHELNTPLGGLRMTLSSVASHMKRMKQEADSLTERQAKHMDMVHQALTIADNNLERAVAVVQQFKRITDGRTRQALTNFKVGLMLEDTLAALKPLRKLHPKVDIVLQGDPELEFCAAAGVVSQVLQSLITNALDHAFPDHSEGEIAIAFNKEEEYVIEVRDNGCGINEADLSKIWEPFFTTGRGEKHSGLGLFMVSQWVNELLNGQITVGPNAPHGTRFVIKIPIHSD